LQSQSGLQNGQRRIGDVEFKVQSELQAVTSALHFYDTQLPVLTASVAVLEEIKAKPIDLDAMVVPTQPLYNQIMKLRAENDAFEELSSKMSKQSEEYFKSNLAKMVKCLRDDCYKKQFMVKLMLDKAEKAAADSVVAAR